MSKLRIIRTQPVSTRRKLYQRDLGLAVLLGGAGLLLVIVLAFGWLADTGLGFWVGLIVALGLLAAGGWFSLTTLKYWQNQRIEERISEILIRRLGDEYIYFRNLTLPGQRSVGEIDGVLLGPPGALVIQIEAARGNFAVEGDTWYRYGRGPATKPTPKPFSQLHSGPAMIEPLSRLDDSPTWTVIRAAREVKAWLSVRELPQVVVQPVVVLGNGQIHNLKRPSAPVVLLAELDHYLSETLLIKQLPVEGEPLAETVVEQIVQRLQTNAE